MRRSLVTVGIMCLALVAGAVPTSGQSDDVTVGDPLRLSTMGPEDVTTTRAQIPQVAYDPLFDRHLVVWAGNDDPGQPSDVDVHGIFVAAEGEVPVGQLQISEVGTPGEPSFATAVAVVHNLKRREFLVAWAGAAGNVNPDFDIWVQRIDASTGAKIGDAVRISSMADPVPIVGLGVTYNAVDEQYMVVWAGIDDAPDPPLERFEDEVYGQLLDSTGAEIGEDDFRISHVQGDGETGQVEVFWADVAHNPAANEYLVVWDGLAYLGAEVLMSGLELEQYFVDLEYEIFGARLTNLGGVEGPELLLSADELPGAPPEPLPDAWPFEELDDIVPDRSTARRPQVAYNELSDEYLVVWTEDGGDNGLAIGESEVFGTVVGASAGRLRGDKIQITSHGPPGELAFATVQPDVAVDGETGDYLVVYTASDPLADLDAAGGPTFGIESEVFGQWLSPLGDLTDGPYQLTATGPSGDPDFDAFDGTVSYSGPRGEFLVVWSGNAPGMASAETELAGTTSLAHDVEVFAQYIESPGAQPPATTTTLGLVEPPPTVTGGAGAGTTTVGPAANGGGASTAGIVIAAVAIAAIVGLVIQRRRR